VHDPLGRVAQGPLAYSRDGGSGPSGWLVSGLLGALAVGALAYLGLSRLRRGPI
jgi:hypothetical protein